MVWTSLIRSTFSHASLLPCPFSLQVYVGSKRFVLRKSKPCTPVVYSRVIFAGERESQGTRLHLSAGDTMTLCLLCYYILVLRNKLAVYSSVTSKHYYLLLQCQRVLVYMYMYINFVYMCIKAKEYR